MRNSLRLRLLAAMVLVTVLAVAVTAAIANRTTADQFRQYADRRIGRRDTPFVSLLGDFYIKNLGWQGVQPLIEDLAQAVNERVVLTDPIGRVVADSGKDLLGQIFVDNNPASFVPVSLPDKAGFSPHSPSRSQMIARLYFDPFKVRKTEDNNFLAGITRSVLIAALAVLAAAFLVTFFISRTIIRPLEQLTTAVQRMEKGDLSARVTVRSQDEVGKLAAAFNDMAGSLARLEELRRNMVSDVAHELRTPLTNVRGYLEAVRDGLLPPDAQLVDNLYEEAMLLNRLVDDLQDLAQAEAGQIRLDLQPQDVNQILETAAAICQPQAHMRGIELQTDTPTDLPVVRVDEHRLLQVLRNLVNNAIDYSPEGGTVKISARTKENKLLLSVSDQGPGLAPEQLSQVFERFYRADPSRARTTGGAGLGLAIVKKLVDLHNGQVWVESSPGQGATFFIQLPIG